MDKALFFDRVRAPIFGGHMTQAQVDGCETLISAFGRYGDGDMRKLAYVLATSFHETNATMQPVREAYWLSEAWRKKHLRYHPFYGRGYVQLTWEANYRDWSARLGLDLVKTPDLAMRPDLAARICVDGMMLGTFTGHKLSDYITPLKCDYAGARRVVNGTDKAALIAGYADRFAAALSAAMASSPRETVVQQLDPETVLRETPDHPPVLEAIDPPTPRDKRSTGLGAGARIVAFAAAVIGLVAGWWSDAINWISSLL